MLQRGFEFAPGYRLEAFLGEGQFGQVWRVTAPGQAAAAVKFVDLSKGQWEREYDGIRRVKGVRHPNLMPITAIWFLGEDGKVLQESAAPSSLDTTDLDSSMKSNEWIPSQTSLQSARWLAVAMLLGGKNLEQRLKDCVREGHGGIPAKELLGYIGEAAKGIDFLNSPVHDFGDGLISVQHCDIKPANIVLLGTSAMVCDFGVARIMGQDQIMATSMAGTAAYMPPEAIEKKPSRASDQYALAITYYQLRTNQLPFSTESFWDVIRAHQKGTLNFDGVEEPVRQVLLRATALDWTERFDTSEEMVDALRRAEFSEPLLPGPVSPPAPQSKQAYWIVAAIATLLLVAFGTWKMVPGLSGTPDLDDLPIPPPPPPPVLTEEELRQVLELVQTDEKTATTNFHEMLTLFPRLGTPAMARLIGGVKTMERLEFVGGSDAGLVAYGSDDYRIMHFDLESLPPASADGNYEYPMVELKGHSGSIDAFSALPNSTLAASGDGNGEVCFWDLAAAKKSSDGNSGEFFAPLAIEELNEDVLSLAWYTRGAKFLVVGTIDGKVHLISVEERDGNLSVRRRGQFDVGEAFEQIQFDASGSYLVAINGATELVTIAWHEITDGMVSKDAKAPKVSKISTGGSRVRSFQFIDASNNEQLIVASGEDGEISFYDFEGELREKLSGLAEGAITAFAIAGNYEKMALVSGGENGEVVVERTGKPRLTFADQSGSISGADTSDDGRWAATTSWDKTVVVRNVDDNPDSRFVLSNDSLPELYSVRLHPSGRWLFAGGANGNLILWDFRHIELLLLEKTYQVEPNSDASVTESE